LSIEPRLREVLEWLFVAEAPAEIEAKAREILLDTFGCVLASSTKPALQRLSSRLAASDPGAVRVPGFPEPLSAASASAIFAIAACWDEACEGLARAHGRPGVPVIAAVAALAQVRNATLGEVLAALLTGYEVGGRLGEALRIAPGMHVDGTWPAFGVAAAAVRFAGGGPEQALAAVRIAACQMPYSLYLPVVHGAEARNTYLAHSAQLGVLAANAALAGFGVPTGALDELRTRVLGAAPGVEAALAPAGAWLISDAYLKPYAAVRHVHYGVAAALGLRPELEGRLDRIDRIGLATYAEALTYCANRAPQSPIQAQFSLSYGIARAIVAGDLGPDAYTEEALADPLGRSLESKVSLTEDEGLSRSGRRGATLSVEIGGERRERTVDRVAGDPSVPMTRQEIAAKFAHYARRAPHAAPRFLDAPAGRRFAELLEELAALAEPSPP
jgi:2-methylcitrate dehydratase PrpD